MADKLIVCDDLFGDLFRIAWYLEDEGNTGAILGEDAYDSRSRDYMKKDNPFSAENREQDGTEHTLYTQEALKLLSSKFSGMGIDYRGFLFDSRKIASNVLTLIKKSAKARIEKRPLPNWAKTALAQGWKMPKGWKP